MGVFFVNRMGLNRAKQPGRKRKKEKIGEIPLSRFKKLPGDKHYSI